MNSFDLHTGIYGEKAEMVLKLIFKAYHPLDIARLDYYQASRKLLTERIMLYYREGRGTHKAMANYRELLDEFSHRRSFYTRSKPALGQTCVFGVSRDRFGEVLVTMHDVLNSKHVIADLLSDLRYQLPAVRDFLLPATGIMELSFESTLAMEDCSTNFKVGGACGEAGSCIIDVHFLNELAQAASQATEQMSLDPGECGKPHVFYGKPTDDPFEIAKAEVTSANAKDSMQKFIQIFERQAENFREKIEDLRKNAEIEVVEEATLAGLL